MRKIFSFEWSDVLGTEWLCVDNLTSCLFSGHFVTGQNIKVEDITQKAKKALGIGQPPLDVDEFYEDKVDVTKAFLVEWVGKMPESMDEEALRGFLFTPNCMNPTNLKIRSITYPNEVKDADDKSDFRKMGHTDYMHKDEVVELVKELADKLMTRPNAKSVVVATVNALLRSKGIGHREVALNWNLVVVPAEVKTIADDECNKDD